MCSPTTGSVAWITGSEVSESMVDPSGETGDTRRRRANQHFQANSPGSGPSGPIGSTSVGETGVGGLGSGRFRRDRRKRAGSPDGHGDLAPFRRPRGTGTAVSGLAVQQQVGDPQRAQPLAGLV